MLTGMENVRQSIWSSPCGVEEWDRAMGFGLRAVGLENRPTCAAHLDIGRRRRSFFGRHG